MNENAFKKLYWGFIFVMLSFRIQGFDIIPSLIGYILFAFAFKSLEKHSEYFTNAFKFNIFMIILSVFSIYQPPVQSTFYHIGLSWFISIVLAILSIVLNLLVIYNLFMGIKNMAEASNNNDLAIEAYERWTQYKYLQIAFIFALILVFVPFLSIIFIIVIFIVTILLLVKILGFIKRCEENIKVL